MTTNIMVIIRQTETVATMLIQRQFDSMLKIRQFDTI